jgi:hypothetical protein
MYALLYLKIEFSTCRARIFIYSDMYGTKIYGTHISIWPKGDKLGVHV